jgi:hypothetical protein
MARGKTVLILGGGIGGAVAAIMLPGEHRVVSIEREAKHVFSPSAEVAGKGAPRAFDGRRECSIAIGGRKSGFGPGNFYADPVPEMRLRRLSAAPHLGKFTSEKFRLSGWF